MIFVASVLISVYAAVLSFIPCDTYMIVLFLVETSSMYVSDLQLEITSMYCHVLGRDATTPDELSARLHHWNTLLFVGLFTAKVAVCIWLLDRLRNSWIELWVNQHARITVWHSGNTLIFINLVALRQNCLVMRWLTICSHVNHLSM